MRRAKRSQRTRAATDTNCPGLRESPHALRAFVVMWALTAMGFSLHHPANADENQTGPDAVAAPASIGARKATILIRSITVPGTKSNGERWDLGSLPDPFSEVRIDGRRTSFLRTKTAKDTLKAKIDETPIRVRAGDTLRIKVFDKDIAFDDTIGEVEGEITQELIDAGSARWSSGDLSIEVELQPLQSDEKP